ncbi:hypothetical protein LINPERPRIM_LOCUS3441 [Linum perenne]
MAIKGNNSSSSNSSNGGNRGRPYGVMLLIAFGAALLGVLVVHKLRERRIFNILVTEKEQQLYSLHLLLQKEREEGNEMKKKAEEMKTKLNTLRTQKMELDRRVLEMQSTIDSLKDEGKALETALEEKQSEIKRLRDATTADGDKEDARIVALAESVKQKEVEIQELKRQLEDHHVKVWSVGSDDPSSNAASSNGTKVDGVSEKSKEVGENGIVNSTRSGGDDENAASGKENGRGTDRRKLTRDEELVAAGDGASRGLVIRTRHSAAAEVSKDIINTAREEPAKHRPTEKEYGGGSGKLPDGDNGRMSRVEGLPAAWNGSSSQDLVMNTTTSDAAKVNKEIINTSRTVAAEDRHMEHGESDDNVSQAGIRGGMRMEMKDEVESGKRKHVHSRKARGKKWRMLARKRWLGNNMSHGNNEEAETKNSGSSSSEEHQVKRKDSQEATHFGEERAAVDGAVSELRNLRNTEDRLVHKPKVDQRRTSDQAVQHVEDEEAGGIQDGKDMDNENRENKGDKVEVAEKHTEEGTEGTEVQLEKGVEDADLMYQEAESDSNSLDHVKEKDPSEF